MFAFSARSLSGIWHFVLRTSYPAQFVLKTLIYLHRHNLRYRKYVIVAMKKVGRILLISAMLLTAREMAMASGDDPVVVVQSKNKDFFVIKADRKLVGARVDVFYANGDVVTRQTLERRKMIIDFGDVRPGLYTIRVSKENQVEEFKYNKM